MRKTLKDKLTKEVKPILREIILYGTPQAKYLDNASLNVASMTKRTSANIETLKMSANFAGAFSLASNQIALDHSYFIIAKKLREGIWLKRHLEKEIAYNVFINPKILAQSQVEKSSFLQSVYSFIISFKNMDGNIVQVTPTFVRV